jgi:hypothetical protein
MYSAHIFVNEPFIEAINSFALDDSLALWVRLRKEMQIRGKVVKQDSTYKSHLLTD